MPAVSSTQPRAPHPAHAANKKRLIICCDGTWQASDTASRAVESNVTKLSRALASSERLPDGSEIQQVVYYQAGVGTVSCSAQTRVSWGVAKFFETGLAAVQAMLGLGLEENVIEAYFFLVNNYEPGDELYLFGFSRGAYTARCLAGLIDAMGILTKYSAAHFPTYYAIWRRTSLSASWAAYADEHGLRTPRNVRTDDTGSWRVPVEVLGVWDTVGALGVPNWSWVEWMDWNRGYKFHRADLPSNVKNAYHALALDEHRYPYSPTLWHIPEDTPYPDQTLIQCWFPGYHINVGGGSPRTLNRARGGGGDGIDWHSTTHDLENIADIAFSWMVSLCRAQLAFDPLWMRVHYAQYVSYLTRAGASDWAAALQPGWLTRAPPKPRMAWAQGPLTDPFYTPESRLCGWHLRTPGRYDPANKSLPRKTFTSRTHECVHPAVRIRYAHLGRPEKPEQNDALHGFELCWRGKGAHGFWDARWSDWVWIREGGTDGEPVVLPEWRLIGPGERTEGEGEAYVCETALVLGVGEEIMEIPTLDQLTQRGIRVVDDVSGLRGNQAFA